MTLLAAAPAQARECVVGWITHVDHLNDTLMLDSGRVFAVSGDINLDALRDGVRVKLVVAPSDQGGKVLSVAPAATPPSAPSKDRRV